MTSIINKVCSLIQHFLHCMKYSTGSEFLVHWPSALIILFMAVHRSIQCSEACAHWCVLVSTRGFWMCRRYYGHRHLKDVGQLIFCMCDCILFPSTRSDRLKVTQNGATTHQALIDSLFTTAQHTYMWDLWFGFLEFHVIKEWSNKHNWPSLLPWELEKPQTQYILSSRDTSWDDGEALSTLCPEWKPSIWCV